MMHPGIEIQIDNKTAVKKPGGYWKPGLGPAQDSILCCTTTFIHAKVNIQLLFLFNVDKPFYWLMM